MALRIICSVFFGPVDKEGPVFIDTGVIVDGDVESCGRGHVGKKSVDGLSSAGINCFCD